VDINLIDKTIIYCSSWALSSLRVAQEGEKAIMRQIKIQKDYTRRQLISDCVSAYIRNNPEEYKLFLKTQRMRRAKLFDPKFGEFTDDKKAHSTDKFRSLYSMPDKLDHTINVLLKAHQQPEFLDDEVKGESKWFFATYPEFLTPEKY